MTTFIKRNFNYNFHTDPSIMCFPIFRTDNRLILVMMQKKREANVNTENQYKCRVPTLFATAANTFWCFSHFSQYIQRETMLLTDATNMFSSFESDRSAVRINPQREGGGMQWMSVRHVWRIQTSECWRLCMTRADNNNRRRQWGDVTWFVMELWRNMVWYV